MTDLCALHHDRRVSANTSFADSITLLRSGEKRSEKQNTKTKDEKKPLRSDSGFFIRQQSRFACATSVRILFVPDWFPAIF
jgi:hypothetical protein